MSPQTPSLTATDMELPTTAVCGLQCELLIGTYICNHCYNLHIYIVPIINTMTLPDAINLKSKCASETSTVSTDTANGRRCCPSELISSHLGYLLLGNGLVLGSASHSCCTLGVLIHLVAILCQTNCSCSYKVLVHAVHSSHHFIYLHKHTVQLLYTPTFVYTQAHFPKEIPGHASPRSTWALQEHHGDWSSEYMAGNCCSSGGPLYWRHDGSPITDASWVHHVLWRSSL